MGRRRFHDTKLSPLLDAARHAVAIDERRWDFEPTLWRLDDIEGEPGLDLSRYKQEWFPGVHGAVGGGCPEVKLSSEALLWVLEGARERGLRVDGGMKRGWGEAARYDGDLRAGYKGGGGLITRRDGESVEGPRVTWNGRRHSRRQPGRWARAWSPKQISRETYISIFPRTIRCGSARRRSIGHSTFKVAAPCVGS